MFIRMPNPSALCHDIRQLKRDQPESSTEDDSGSMPALKKYRSTTGAPVPAALSLLSMAHSTPSNKQDDTETSSGKDSSNYSNSKTASTEDEKRSSTTSSQSEDSVSMHNHVKPLELLVQPGGGRIRFPDKLMAYLQKNAAPNQVLWWLPDGSAFAFDSERIHQEFLDLYFRGTKLTSFIRSLNRWGFRRVFYHSLPKNTLSFHHPLFQRETPETVRDIKMVTYNPRDGKDDAIPTPNEVHSNGSSSSQRASSPYSATHIPGFVRGAPASPIRAGSSDAGSLTGSQQSGSVENMLQRQASPVQQLAAAVAAVASPPRSPRPQQQPSANPALETLVQQLVRGTQNQQQTQAPQNLNSILQVLASQQPRQAPAAQQQPADSRQIMLQQVLGLVQQQPQQQQRRPSSPLGQLLQQQQQPAVLQQLLQQQPAVLQQLLQQQQQQQNLQAPAHAPAANSNLHQLVEAAMAVERDRQALQKVTDQFNQSQNRYQAIFQQWQSTIQSTKP